MRILYEMYEKVMIDLWDIDEKLKLTKGHEKFMRKSRVTRNSTLNLEENMKQFIYSPKEVMRKSWDSHKKFTRKSCKINRKVIAEPLESNDKVSR